MVRFASIQTHTHIYAQIFQITSNPFIQFHSFWSGRPISNAPHIFIYANAVSAGCWNLHRLYDALRRLTMPMSVQRLCGVRAYVYRPTSIINLSYGTHIGHVENIPVSPVFSWSGDARTGFRSGQHHHHHRHPPFHNMYGTHTRTRSITLIKCMCCATRACISCWSAAFGSITELYVFSSSFNEILSCLSNKWLKTSVHLANTSSVGPLILVTAPVKINDEIYWIFTLRKILMHV